MRREVGELASFFRSVRTGEALWTEHLEQTPLHFDIETTIEYGIESAVQTRHSLGKHYHRVWNRVRIIAPDPDQMHDKIRSPTEDETADDTQRHLDGLDLRSRYRLRVLADGLA